MYQTVEITIPPELRDETAQIRALALRKARLPDVPDIEAKVIRRSLDARKHPRYVLRVALFRNGGEAQPSIPREQFQDVSSRPEVYIIGAGPAGYFAALELIRKGFKPIVLERGKDVRERRRDLRMIQQFGVVNTDSNYCFGEGGAGTYSDGKLYTRATRRGDVRDVLQILVDHGATEEILVEAHPHIGSNKLPGIVSRIRQTIEQAGGIVRFNARVTDIFLDGGKVKGISINDSLQMPVHSLILATGHSARDIFELLYAKNVRLEFKPFALGVRIEHPQPLIDKIQYGQPRGTWLPAAAYQFACQVKDRGVFTFCMCPGGLIVPAATSPGEIVVNGMSLSRRDSPFANSGWVVTITEADVQEFSDRGPLAGVAFQSMIECNCFAAGNGSQSAPAQRITDFLMDQVSQDLPRSSYIPGIFSYPVRALFPENIAGALRQGLEVIRTKLPGYITSEGVIVATESRTSSPVRIPRDPVSRMHPDVEGLYPCGEGAGYAGGIVSAAMDGQNVARAVAAGILSQYS